MTGEPTLHYNDHGADGWVEYAQGLLNEANGGSIKFDGWFGDETIKAVYQFQQAQGLQVDGVIGDQTWAALRGDEAVAPHADGHQHEQTDPGPHVIYDKAHEQPYDAGNDMLFFQFDNVGARDIPAGEFWFDVNITGPSGFKHYELPMAENGPVPPGGLLWASLEHVRDELGTGDFSWVGEIAPGAGGDKQEGAFTIQ